MSGWASGPEGRPYGMPAGGPQQGGQAWPQWQPAAAPPPRNSRPALRVALGVMAAGAVAAVAGILVPAATTGHRTLTMPGASMEPTYRPGDKVTVEKADGAALRDGDIVLFDGHDWGVQGLLLERVIARGGEHLVMTANGTVTVDGEVRREPYLYPGSENGISPPLDLVVPAGRLFMMGDHRSDSADSRFHISTAHGTIAESAVTGRAVDPADTSGPDHRWAAAGAAVAVAGLAAAVVIATRSRRTTPPPPSY
ncbi:MAG: signal peptidase I [Streptomyces sp.]|nr:signal peptidase I [Streptomyces sp.]